MPHDARQVCEPFRYLAITSPDDRCARPVAMYVQAERRTGATALALHSHLTLSNLQILAQSDKR